MFEIFLTLVIPVIIFLPLPVSAQVNPVLNHFPVNPFRMDYTGDFKSRNEFLFSEYKVVSSGSKKSGGTPDEYGIIDVSFKAGYLREIEELYNTNDLYQSLILTKRFSRKFQLSLNPAIEYSKRVSVDQADQNRWYDNTALRGEYDFSDYNIMTMFISGSISDTTLTAYGATWKSVIDDKELQFKNNLVLSYDYFYFWNQVAQNFVSDNLNINYDRFGLAVGYFFGVVDFNYVDGFDAKARNPNTTLSLDLQYKILYKPAVSAGVQFSARNFKYYSPLYYSPQKRKIGGVNVSFYNAFGKYYLYLGTGSGMDNNDNFIWNVDGEAGYDTGNFSISAGLSRYNDPYYTSYNTFLNLTKSF